MEINNLDYSVRQGKKQQFPLICTLGALVKAGGYSYTFAYSWARSSLLSSPLYIWNQLKGTLPNTVFIMFLARDWSKRVT